MKNVNLFKANFTQADLSHLTELDPRLSTAILCKTIMKDKISNRDCKN